jgi:hypothetical protein
MKVVPAAGRAVRDPRNMQLLPEAGREVSDSDPFWVRRVRDGDVTVVTDPPPEATRAGRGAIDDARTARTPAPSKEA